MCSVTERKCSKILFLCGWEFFVLNENESGKWMFEYGPYYMDGFEKK